MSIRKKLGFVYNVILFMAIAFYGTCICRCCYSGDKKLINTRKQVGNDMTIKETIIILNMGGTGTWSIAII